MSSCGVFRHIVDRVGEAGRADVTAEQQAPESAIRELIERWAAAVREEELAKNPDVRLRLTVGLRREGGRWVVSHEHHSFPAT
jgi:ketosteroid isomerase-like protein